MRLPFLALTWRRLPLTPRSTPTVMQSFAASLRRPTHGTASGAKIHVVDAEGTSHRVIVPPGMMTDIVKPLWESEVEIMGTRKRSAIHLTSIRPAKTQIKA